MKLAARIDAIVERLVVSGIDIEAIAHAPWIRILDIEYRIGRSLPPTYRELVLRYTFPSIELGPIILFSNRGDHSYDDVSSAPFKDPILSPWLLRSGFFHIARTSCDDYDPVCLELKSPQYPREVSPVIKFNHEAILIEDATVPCCVIAKSFLGLLEDHA